MSKLYVKTSFCFICFFFTLCINAQIEKDAFPLIEILSEIQSRFDVQFNYAEEKLLNIELEKPSENFSLLETLDYLSTKTDFSYIRLGEHIIYVKASKSSMLCGFLIDAETGLKIANATIQSNIENTISDKKGYFEIAIESDQLLIRHLGYQNVTQISAIQENNECYKILLRPLAESLSEVVITNYLVQGITKMTDGSLKINFSEFSMLPGLIETDVLQSAQAMPGIQSVDETVSNINIRGGTNDQNLVLWDDMKMYQTGHFFGLVSSFNSQITDNVSINKNGTDVAYSDGTSGSIQMRTNSNINDSLTGSIGINFLSADAFVDLPLGKKSSLQLSGRSSLGYKVPTSIYEKYFNRISQNTEIQNNGINITSSDKEFDFSDITLRWLYNPTANSRLRINFISFQDNLEFYENGILNGEQVTKESNLAQTSIAGGVFYENQWSNTFSTSAIAYYTNYDLNAQNANIENDTRLTEDNAVVETSLKFITNLAISKVLNWKNGYHYTNTGISNLDENDTTSVTNKIADHGLFSSLQFRSDDAKTTIDGGLRVDYITQFDTFLVEPRLNINHRFSREFTLQILGEFKHQNTSQIVNFQSDFFGIESRRWQLANDNDIPIIKSKQLSLGVSYDRYGWLVAVDGYYKNVDGITSQSQGFTTKYQYEKAIGSYEVVGFDFLIRKKYKRFSNWISYTVLKNDYTFKNFEEVSFPSNLDIRHSITLASTYSKDRLKVSAGLNYHTGKPTTKPITDGAITEGMINYESANVNNVSDYLKADISGIYNIPLSNRFNGDIGFSISNIFNRKNVIDEFYGISDGSTLQKFQQNSLGLTTNVVFRVRF